jgi:hypothetical protein
MKKLIAESLIEYLNEENNSNDELSNFKDVLSSSYSKKFKVPLSKAKSIINGISSSSISQYKELLELDEKTISKIVEEIHNNR